MSNPPWMNGGAQAPVQGYAQQPTNAQPYAPQGAPPQQLPPANAAASMHWINAIATAAPPAERLPQLAVGHSYVLDVVEFDEPTPSKNPATSSAVYFGATFRVVESTDPALPPGSTCTKRENLTVYGGPGRSQAMLQTALESFAGRRVELANVDQFRQAIAFAIAKPCPLAGKSRVYASCCASQNKDKDGNPYPNITWEPMPMGGTKGLVAAQAPAGGVFAGAPWAGGGQQAPAQAQQPAATPAMPWMNGGGQR